MIASKPLRRDNTEASLDGKQVCAAKKYCIQQGQSEAYSNKLNSVTSLSSLYSPRRRTKLLNALSYLDERKQPPVVGRFQKVRDCRDVQEPIRISDGHHWGIWVSLVSVSTTHSFFWRNSVWTLEGRVPHVVFQNQFASPRGLPVLSVTFIKQPMYVGGKWNGMSEPSVGRCFCPSRLSELSTLYSWHTT